MGFQTIPILSIILTVAQLVHGDVWEFGNAYVPDDRVISHEEGSMGIFDRTKKIRLKIPPCYTVTYVRVEISNILSSPKVLYNTHTHDVTISYKFWQNSMSSYEILGKGSWIPGCSIAPPSLNPYG